MTEESGVPEVTGRTFNITREWAFMGWDLDCVYSLKEGIEDGFLAPYKVVRVDIDIDSLGWRPTKGQLDNDGKEIQDRIYNVKDFDRTMVIDERAMLVAETMVLPS